MKRAFRDFSDILRLINNKNGSGNGFICFEELTLDCSVASSSHSTEVNFKLGARLRLLIQFCRLRANSLCLFGSVKSISIQKKTLRLKN
ncbi:hypothetical protein BpHYR1_021766 [Brachionus plicatilis]|uniref:Uncharacterized protein n=1 Tax=Brachionus plicatilis TaxID=10195 RepID=A0A3M7QX87_BRAPC|nr:hypothetical protein BpHYR1_021766 [Brachionus plicatilis]